MKLQIALDTLDIDQCIQLVDPIQSYLNILEVGTPFIIEEGLRPVRILKKKFPHLAILADAKIMDAGYYEAQKCFKAGADIVTVLALSHDETIQGVIQASQETGGQVMVDMIGCENIDKRAQELEQMGAHILCVHTAFDQQSLGNSPLADLKRLKTVTSKVQTAVAGGVKLDTLDPIVEQQPDIVIVGAALCQAKDPLTLAKMMKEKMCS